MCLHVLLLSYFILQSQEIWKHLQRKWYRGDSSNCNREVFGNSLVRTQKKEKTQCWISSQEFHKYTWCKWWKKKFSIPKQKHIQQHVITVQLITVKSWFCTSFSDIRMIVLFRYTSRDMHFWDDKNDSIYCIDFFFIDATNSYFHNTVIA